MKRIDYIGFGTMAVLFTVFGVCLYQHPTVCTPAYIVEVGMCTNNATFEDAECAIRLDNGRQLTAKAPVAVGMNYTMCGPKP
jgi:hypothetical protein